jgi:hypothetical protein
MLKTDKMTIIRGTPVVTLVYDADDWELYSSMEGTETAAIRLNNTFMKAVNSGQSRSEVEYEMSILMFTLRKFGASDTEPQYCLHQLLNKVFGTGEPI